MNAHAIHTCSYQCERPECIRAQRDELAAKQCFTAADMADQAAAAFERGRESVLAERAAAAQEAVAWTVVGPDGKSSIGGWQDMKTHDFWKEAGVLREGHRYAYAYAAPVAAAPGIDLRSRVLRLADKWEKQAAEHGVRQFTGNDHLLFANELRVQIDASPQEASDAR